MKPAPKHVEFSTPVANLDVGGKRFEAPIPVDWLRTILEGSEAVPAFGEGHLDLQLSKSGSDVVVRGHAKAKVQLACGRCLKPVEVALAPKISALMVPTSKLASQLKHPVKDEHEFAAGDADVMAYDGETVVLDDLVRDELVLDIPMIPLCSDSCPGISTQPRAAEPTVDPRLAPLLALKNKKKE